MDKVQFFAEICSNHNGDLARAIALIDAAADIGCDGVKFQLFRIDQLYAPEILEHPDYRDMLNDRRRWELPLEWLPELAEACRERGLLFGCTPFYLEAVTKLAPYVDYFKIASYELPWPDLLAKIIRDTGLPVMMSCGMATMEEIKGAVYEQAILSGGEIYERLTLLHCVSRYPTPPEQGHLSFIGRLRTEINTIARVGYSDHSVSPGVIQRAVHRHGARVVEFHLDLDDRRGDEYKLGHCWTPGEMIQVITDIREGVMADGDPNFNPTQILDRHFRADPADGLRPMRYIREKLANETAYNFWVKDGGELYALHKRQTQE